MKSNKEPPCFKIICFLILAWVLFGCKSGKPLVSSEMKSFTDISEYKDVTFNREQKILEHLDKLEKSLFNENVTVTTVTTEYDTNQPVNQDTGKPPVKTETKTEITKNKNGETISTDNSTVFNEIITKLKDNSIIDTKTSQIEKSKQESPKDPYRYRYIFYSIAVLAILVIFFNWSKIFSFIYKK